MRRDGEALTTTSNGSVELRTHSTTPTRGAKRNSEPEMLQRNGLVCTHAVYLGNYYKE